MQSPIPTNGSAKIRCNLQKVLDICSKTPNFLTIFSHENPLSCLVQPRIVCWQRKKKTPLMQSTVNTDSGY